MDTIKIENLNLQTDQPEVKVILMHGEHEEIRDERPGSYNISGVITAPLDWWKIHSGNINHDEALILYSISKRSICLRTELFLQHSGVCVEGKFSESNALEQLRIGKQWDLQDLATFIRINKRIFPDKQAADQLRKTLSKFKASVQKEYEENKEWNGNKKMLIEHKVQHDLPEKISVSVPLFTHSEQPTTFDLFFEVSDSDSGFRLKFLSPNLNEIIEKSVREQFAPILSKFNDIIPVIQIS